MTEIPRKQPMPEAPLVRVAQPWLGPARNERGPLVQPRTVARWLLVLVLLAGVYFFKDFLVRKRRPNGTFRMTRGGAMFEACEGFDT